MRRNGDISKHYRAIINWGSIAEAKGLCVFPSINDVIAKWRRALVVVVDFVA